jgi:excisionase family DNA binding protein
MRPIYTKPMSDTFNHTTPRKRICMDAAKDDEKMTNEAPTVPCTHGAPASAFFEPLLTAKQVAPLLDIHPGTLLRWAREGIAPCVRKGRKWVRFRASVLNQWSISGYTNAAARAAQP